MQEGNCGDIEKVFQEYKKSQLNVHQTNNWNFIIYIINVYIL